MRVEETNLWVFFPDQHWRCQASVLQTPPVWAHELKVIDKLADQLQRNGLIKDDDGLWGAIIVLAVKLHQEEVPWHKYKWRLCVSY